MIAPGRMVSIVATDINGLSCCRSATRPGRIASLIRDGLPCPDGKKTDCHLIYCISCLHTLLPVKPHTVRSFQQQFVPCVKRTEKISVSRKPFRDCLAIMDLAFLGEAAASCVGHAPAICFFDKSMYTVVPARVEVSQMAGIQRLLTAPECPV